MPKIGGLILAAGGSTRLGHPKQLIDFNGETLVHAAVRAAREGGCGSVGVVTGYARYEVENAVADLRPHLVHNDAWQRGMGGSVRRGLVSFGDISVLVILVCDQPAVDGQVVRALIELYAQTGFPVVASAYSGTLGIPALFDRSCFSDLLHLPDAQGAKSVIHAYPDRVAVFEFAAGAMDLDSPADLQAWRARRSTT